MPNTKILKENKELVYRISDVLIEHETITKEEIEELVETGKISKYEVVEKKEKTKKEDLK